MCFISSLGDNREKGSNRPNLLERTTPPPVTDEV